MNKFGLTKEEEEYFMNDDSYQELLHKDKFYEEMNGHVDFIEKCATEGM